LGGCGTGHSAKGADILIIFTADLKVLIIRFSSIGDIVLTTPVVRCLKQQVPGVEVHYLTKKQFAPLLTTNIYIDKVIPLSDSLTDTARVLKQEQYDWVIDLHHNIRTLKVKTLLRRPSKAFNKLNFKKWLLVYLKKDSMPPIHIVDRYLDTVAHLGVKNDGMGLDYFIPADTSFDYTTLPPAFTNGYLAFAIGGQHATKKMPNHKIVEVLKNTQYPVVLLGGKEDAANGDAILKLAHPSPVANLCGQLSLHQSALVVKNAKGLLTHDTGMMHIGAALDTPILSIWGNTVPQLGMYPYYKTNSEAALKAEMFEVLGLKCRPCSKIGFDKCPKGHFDCMEKQDAAAIAQKAKALV
jgi:ADP-heptose:LPS heptosyltransferase